MCAVGEHARLLEVDHCVVSSQGKASRCALQLGGISLPFQNTLNQNQKPEDFSYVVYLSSCFLSKQIFTL